MDTHLHIHPIPAFKDNYIWIIHNNQHAIVVDPGDAAVVLAYLIKHQLNLTAILITHHHHDHIGGIAKLVDTYAVPVYGPALENIPHRTHALREGDIVHIASLNLNLKTLDIPGHTAGHIAYYGANSVFCGDTLFGCGCGRLFEGTPAQMLASLSKLAQLPADTAVYCAHEYTLSGINFALTLESENVALQQRLQHDQALRDQDLPTLPSTLAIEKATNPFLRCHLPSIQIRMGFAINADNTLATFTAVRTLKDNS
ncbi:hydroxyacylglutathione hydrolase [Sulfuriferula nivalis]|uniref:Hydroxyacylglutathione hydrolase n=1 Tax=Sulfuriferula nivalis TaxID=2675298 RepID=A0A809S9T1_9PROT|nr:hydroxyacylglutathione hydrolase [Sulfuriferula nivalis]BBP01132.1 hydroxyacylglutathione hydrolase [Sulfuriferula nivalis]